MQHNISFAFLKLVFVLLSDSILIAVLAQIRGDLQVSHELLLIVETGL